MKTLLVAQRRTQVSHLLYRYDNNIKPFGDSRATSRNAKRFLAYPQAQAPFPIRSLQVDGGSVFRDEFEQSCQDLGIPLYVLPPKKPEYNGCVARANGASRYEFYPYLRGCLDGRCLESKTGGVSDPLQYLSTRTDGISLLTPDGVLSATHTDRLICLICIEPGQALR